MQAIQVTFKMSPSGNMRLIAKCAAKRKIFDRTMLQQALYKQGISADNDSCALFAAQSIADELEWNGTLHGGTLADNSYVFVFVHCNT